MANGFRTDDLRGFNKGRSSKFHAFDKHLKKAGGHIGRHVVEITIKMKTIFRKPLMIKIIKLRHINWNWAPGSGFLNNSEFSLTWRLTQNTFPLLGLNFRAGLADMLNCARCSSSLEEMAEHAFYYCERIRLFCDHVREWTARIEPKIASNPIFWSFFWGKSQFCANSYNPLTNFSINSPSLCILR